MFVRLAGWSPPRSSTSLTAWGLPVCCSQAQRGLLEQEGSLRITARSFAAPRMRRARHVAVCLPQSASSETVSGQLVLLAGGDPLAEALVDRWSRLKRGAAAACNTAPDT